MQHYAGVLLVHCECEQHVEDCLPSPGQLLPARQEGAWGPQGGFLDEQMVHQKKP